MNKSGSCAEVFNCLLQLLSVSVANCIRSHSHRNLLHLNISGDELRHSPLIETELFVATARGLVVGEGQKFDKISSPICKKSAAFEGEYWP